jgi:hypothetical protein
VATYIAEKWKSNSHRLTLADGGRDPHPSRSALVPGPARGQPVHHRKPVENLPVVAGHGANLVLMVAAERLKELVIDNGQSSAEASDCPILISSSDP